MGILFAGKERSLFDITSRDHGGAVKYKHSPPAPFIHKYQTKTGQTEMAWPCDSYTSRPQSVKIRGLFSNIEKFC